MYRLLVICVVLHLGRAQECDLPQQLIDEINSYQPTVDAIVDAIQGSYAGVVFQDLAEFVDTFGPRPSGSKNLEESIDDVMGRMAAAGLTVSEDPVLVPHWIRGKESLELLTPRPRSLNVLGLGLSPGTPPEGITAEILVVEDFDQLTAMESQVPGKIVVYNSKYVSYGVTGEYRRTGPYEAAKRGAVAALVRSITPFSIDSPHTGSTRFLDDVTPIPCAAITLEDADTLARLTASGKTVTVKLKMGARRDEDRPSRNALGDLVGSSKPDEYVAVSGHIDSWDVGQGAMDDAGGCFVSWHALALIKKLGLPQTKRTMRAVLWTAEEVGVSGVLSYVANHAEELEKWSAAFESDMGVFEATGLSFAGNQDATCIMRSIAALFTRLNATALESVPVAGSDISALPNVPTGEPKLVENQYFWYHHSGGDAMNVLDTKDMDQVTALFAATAYILADLSIQLPRGDQTAQQLMNNIGKS